MSAPITLVEMTAQGCGSAVPNIVKRFPLLTRQYAIPAGQEIALMGAEDIGQFWPMWFHGSIGGKLRSSESSGLEVERTATSATCR
jgi:hypothetical protein